ncbi:MAG: cytochrome c oxidase subunit II [Bryobacteraceae bacterium]|nr:cytochrome c oxidase subunit II [Bryobacteraceae bacterium]
MRELFRFFPDSASSISDAVDALYLWLTTVSTIMTLLIFLAIGYFAIRYRRREPGEVPTPVLGSLRLEILWSVIPFLVMLSFFTWGTYLYFHSQTSPKGGMEVFITGKQWMWKIQHPSGPREINELHVPIGVPVNLTLASEDVIHSFFVPAFRIKKDVVPGRLNRVWFQATKPGKYHLFCAEYCGTEHSGMIGWVYAMERHEYEQWLSGGGGEGSMASRGEKLFQQYGCASCHTMETAGRCPSVRGLYGRQVLLRGGEQVTADDSYLRESILNPRAKIVAGFEPIMPTFQGQINEEGLLQIIAYIKSLGVEGGEQVEATRK